MLIDMDRGDVAVEQAEPSLSAPGQDVVRGGLWTALGAIVGTPLSALTNVLIARTLGLDQYGRYGLLLTTWALIGTFVNVGLSSASVQWMAKSRGSGDSAGFLAVVRLSSFYHLFFQAPVLAFSVFLLLQHAPTWVVVIGVGGTLIEQSIGTSSIILTGTARNARAAQISLVSTFSIAAITLGVVLLAPRAETLWGVLRGTALVSVVLCYLSLDKEIRRLLFRPAWPRPLPVGFRVYSLNVAILTLAGTLVFGRSELLVLSADGQTAAAGLFVIATGFAGLITVPMDSLMAPLAPAAAFYTGLSIERAREILLRALRVTSVLGGATASVAPAAIAIFLPQLYGRDFTGGVLAAQILASISLVQSVIGPLGVFALAAERSRELLKISVLAAAVDATVAISAIPFIGLSGAVIASALAQLVHLIAAAEVAARATKCTRVSLLRQSLPAYLGLLIGGMGILITQITSIAGSLLAGFLGIALFRLMLQLMPSLRIPHRDWERLAAGLGRRGQPLGRLARTLLGSA